MARYGKIDARMWGDAKFLALSPPAPNGQTLWTYLLSGPHRTSIPGLFVAGEAMLAEALGWPLKGFREAFAEVLKQGMAEADQKSRVIWIPKAIVYNPPESPNVVKGWRVHLDEIPECSLKDKAYQHLKAFTEAKGEAFREAFSAVVTSGGQRPLPNPEPEPEPEQYPEQEPKPEHLNTLCDVCPTNDEFLTAWNELGKPFGRIIGMGKKRSISLSTRRKDPFWVENWKIAIAKMPTCPFLRGEGANGWIATVDFFLKPDSVQKILEGNYDTGPGKAAAKPFRDKQTQYAADTLADIFGDNHEPPTAEQQRKYTELDQRGPNS